MRPSLNIPLVDKGGQIARPWLDWFDKIGITQAMRAPSTPALRPVADSMEALLWLQPL